MYPGKPVNKLSEGGLVTPTPLFVHFQSKLSVKCMAKSCTNRQYKRFDISIELELFCKQFVAALQDRRFIQN